MNAQASSSTSDQDTQQDTAPRTEQRAVNASASSNAKKSASAFRTISEVADELDVQQHVLRFWETKFSQVRPLKRGGGRRYYRPEDIALLKSIHHLLYTEGYTIKGVQKLLREQGKNSVVQNNKPAAAKPAQASNVQQPLAQKPQQPRQVSGHIDALGLSSKNRKALEAVLHELKDLKGSLSSPE
ncbi:MAG: MerR family transcriptional regulator [Alphaproteobacteria bacterium]|nr:MerR family transcriptional regulator [Alphaproteobacteria bacterium]